MKKSPRELPYPQSQYVGDKWDWKAFLHINTEKKKDDERQNKAMINKRKGKVQEIQERKKCEHDKLILYKERLIHIAQKASFAPDIGEDTLREILAELDRQLETSRNEKPVIDKRTAESNKKKEEMSKEEAKLAKKHKNVRQLYLEEKSTRSFEEKLMQNDLMGSDEDIDSTIEIMQMEIDAVQKEVDYLKLVFDTGNDLIEEELDEIEEEEVDSDLFEE